jgi:hypothetical protein
MSHKTINNGLLALGFNSNWVVNEEEIVLWENPEPQPTIEAILEAAKNYVEPTAYSCRQVGKCWFER